LRRETKSSRELRIGPVEEVSVSPRALHRLEPLIGAERYAELRRAADTAKANLRGRTFWNVSSTAAGGGVAEMLHVLVGYTLDAGLEVRWLVIRGDADFFATTKRLHNRLHGVRGDDGELGAAQMDHYDQVIGKNASDVLSRVRPDDFVLLHDPQTAGLASHLARAGARVVWRCHVGTTVRNPFTEEAWSFLSPLLSECDGYVFSLAAYVPKWMDSSKVTVIPPSIDPFSPKNQDLSALDVERICDRVGLLGHDADGAVATFGRLDGSTGTVRRRASVVAMDGTAFDPSDPLVVQVSRWDRLKDMEGVMRGFVSVVAPRHRANLALVGPSVGEVADDPEGAQVLAECVASWEALPADHRRRIRLVTLPMDDIDENAVMVNALQRRASVIVQKSLAEGFGLTVAEGMWKARAIVASAVGGISEQVVLGTGVLVDDPYDLEAFGEALSSLLEHPEETASMGRRAHRHVLDCFVGDRHLKQYAELVRAL
jgi:trehalose synthase